MTEQRRQRILTTCHNSGYMRNCPKHIQEYLIERVVTRCEKMPDDDAVLANLSHELIALSKAGFCTLDYTKPEFNDLLKEAESDDMTNPERNQLIPQQ
jgi:hypothetical protein